jgi:hypothetical protein
MRAKSLLFLAVSVLVAVLLATPASFAQGECRGRVDWIANNLLA